MKHRRVILIIMMLVVIASWGLKSFYRNKRYAEVVTEIENGGTGKLKKWLDDGCNPNMRDEYGYSLLMLACRYNNIDAAECLLKKGADPNLVNDGVMLSALWIATERYNNDIAKLLLEYGAKLNLKGLRCHVAIKASGAGNLELLKTFKENGLVFTEKLAGECLEAAWYAQKDNVEEYLLQFNPDVNVRSWYRNQTMLFDFAYDEKLSCMEKFITMGGDIDLRDSEGITALIYAAQHGRVKAVDFLLERNAEVKKNDIDKLKQLYKKGIYINEKDGGGVARTDYIDEKIQRSILAKFKRQLIRGWHGLLANP